MEDLFGNIFYLIPIALVIAFRIINARNRNARRNQQQQQKKTSSEQQPVSGGLGELIRKIQEAEDYPEHTKTGKESYRPHWETKPVVVQSGKPGGKKRPSEKKLSSKIPSGSILSDASFVGNEKTFAQASAVKKTKTVPAAAVQNTGLQTLQAGVSGLSPLQQAVVWSEILGKPKGIDL